MTGFEFLIEPVAEGLSSLAINILQSGGKGTIKAIKNKSQHISASRKYIQKYQKDHCELKVLGMREPVELSVVYTGVKLLQDEDTFRFESPQALEEAFRETRLRGYSYRHEETEKASGIVIANEKQYLMVLGGPGAGKSTFLRKIGLEALRTLHYESAEYRHRLIPVFLELKNFDYENVDLKKAVADSFEKSGFPDSENFVERALEQGQLLILLDGLDEVPSANLGSVLKTIQDFVSRYDSNRFVASCRIAASGFQDSAFRRFSNVTMADFDDEQIRQFIINWFSSEFDIKRSTAEKCWEVLQKSENKASKELAHTPLLLTYLCLVYDRSQRFPDNRSSLYKKALRILLEEWASEKRILRDDIYEGLSIEQEETLLSEIAYEGMSADHLFFSKREISTQIKDFLSSNLNAPKHLDSEAVLNAVEVQQGILVERAEDTYSFSHLTLQEYLTAQYLVDNYEWPLLVERHLIDDRWREIFLLLPGLTTGKSGADKLLLLMEKQANQYLQNPQLQQLVRWAELSTHDSIGQSKPAAKRAEAIALVRALARAHAFARDLEVELDRILELDFELELELTLGLAFYLDRELELGLAFDLALELERELERELELGRELGRELECVFRRADFSELIQTVEALREQQTASLSQTKKEKIYKLWFSALGLSSEAATLSEENSQALAHYCYVCELMIRCKENAMRVSDVWEGIESRIFTVPDAS